MTKKNKIITICSLIVVAIIIVVTITNKNHTNADTYKVVRGDFESSIITKGQMKSQEYVKINLPDVMMDHDLRLYQLKINDLVPEGTKVSEGDYVATLDEERIKGEIVKNSDRIRNYRNNFNMGKIDSASDLTSKRNAIKEKEYDLEYKKIEIKQSIYESVSFQDKVKREYSIANRKLEMARRDYIRSELRYKKSCGRDQKRVDELTIKLKKLKQASKESRITAPQDGMIIYAEVWGRSRKKDDYVSIWSPEIAVLPNLNKLVSDTYVEEVDIAKVNIGMPVRIKADALPDKVFNGKVLSLANIGKTLSGVDSKVFDLSIKIDGFDKNIAHGMNTTNEIITHSAKGVLLVPIDYVFNNENGNIVYKQEDGKIHPTLIKYKHSNDKVILVESGVNEGDQLIKSLPQDIK